MAQVKLFVGNIPADVTGEEVQMVFGTYGTVTDCHVMQGRASSGQSCAFVTLDSNDSASAAIEALNGVYSFRDDPSAPISVAFPRQGGAKGKGKETYGKGSWGGGGGAWGGDAWGGDSWGGGGGYAAAAPQYGKSAGKSWNGGGGKDYGGGKGYGGAAAGGGYGGAAAGGYGGGYGGGKTGGKGGKGGSKLFIGNLPPDITAEDIMAVFSSYGTVTNTHLMQGKSLSGQMCGFVEYSNPSEAETAILTLHDQYEIRPGAGAIMVKYSNSGARAAPY